MSFIVIKWFFTPSAIPNKDLMRAFKAFWSASVAISTKALISASSWVIWANEACNLSLFSSASSLTWVGLPFPETLPTKWLSSLITASMAFNTSLCSFWDLMKSAWSAALLTLFLARDLRLAAFCLLYCFRLEAALSLNFSYLTLAAFNLIISLLSLSISFLSLKIF